MYEYKNNDILSVEELQDILRIGKGAAYQLLNSGTIKAFRIGRVWKIPMSILNDFIIQSAKEKVNY